jgi:hypothetical protein
MLLSLYGMVSPGKPRSSKVENASVGYATLEFMYTLLSLYFLMAFELIKQSNLHAYSSSFPLENGQC